jgi:hypothetical protein
MTRQMRPADSAEIDTFMRLYRQLCPTANDEVTVEEFARQLGWPVERTRRVALWLDERRLIETDRGLGTEITIIEGRSGT